MQRGFLVDSILQKRRESPDRRLIRPRCPRWRHQARTQSPDRLLGEFLALERMRHEAETGETYDQVVIEGMTEEDYLMQKFGYIPSLEDFEE